MKLRLLLLRQFLRSPGVHQSEQNLILGKVSSCNSAVHNGPPSGFSAGYRRATASSGGELQCSNGRVKRNDHLRMCSPRIIVPIRHRQGGLPCERFDSVLGGKPKFTAGAFNSANSTKAPGKTRMNRDRNIELVPAFHGT